MGQRREEGVPGAGRRAQVSAGGKAARRRVPAEAALPWVWEWVWGGSAEGGERAARVPPPGTLGETLLSEHFDKRDATGTRSQRWKSPGPTRGSSPGSLPGHAAASHGAPAPLSFPRPPTRAFCSGHAGRAGRCLRRASATGRGPRSLRSRRCRRRASRGVGGCGARGALGRSREGLHVRSHARCSC